MNVSNDPLDLRVRRTYKFLWDALLSLMSERDFESVTVTDICHRAMVHRTTFYKHYEDKYGLLVHGIQEELRALFEAVEKQVARQRTADTRTRLIAVLEYVRKHEEFYRLMLTGDGFPKFSALLRNAVAERLEQNLRQEGTQRSVPAVLHAQLAAAAIVRMIAWWLENDYPYSPAQMIQYISAYFDWI